MTLLHLGLLAILFTFSAGMVLSDANAQTNDLSRLNSSVLPDNGYRHNLVHLTGNYYVSSHTVTAPSTTTPITTLDSEVTLRLYTITDMNIMLIASQVIHTNTQVRTLQLHEFTTEPKSTGLARVDDDTIAVSYVNGGTTSSVVATYDVNTGDTTTPFDTPKSANFREGTTGDQTHHHSMVSLDANRLVLAYSYPDNTPTGFIQVITIDPGNGDLVAGDLVAGTLVPTTDDQGLYNSMVKLDDDTVVLAYRGADAGGFVQAFDILADNTINAYTAAEHEHRRTAYHSLTRVDDNTVAVAYSAIGDAALADDGHGTIKVFDVDSNGIISGKGGQTYQNTAVDATSEERIHINSLAMLDSNTMAIAYRGDEAGGFIRFYDITHTTGGLSPSAGPYEHDTAFGAFNSLLRIDDNMLALVYGGDLPASILDDTATPNRIKTLALVLDDTPPVIESAVAVNANTIVLFASQSLKGDTFAADYTVSANAVTADPVISGNTITVTVGSSIIGGNTVTVGYRGTTVTDVADNALAEFTSLSVTNNLPDITAPTVSITNTVTADGGIATTAVTSYTATFSEVVTGFVETDIAVSGTADTSSPAVSNFDGIGNTYTFDVTATGDGTVIVSIPANAARDAVGQDNTASAPYTVTLDIAIPIATYVNTVGPASLFMGQGNGQFNVPFAVEVTPTNILVADSLNHRIQIFDLDGNYLRQFGHPGDNPGSFSNPRGITANSENILVADTNNNRVQIFDLEGNHVRTIGRGGQDNGEFNAPQGIIVNSTNILVGEILNGRIQVFDLDGNYLSQFGSGGSGDGQFNSFTEMTSNSTHILVSDTNNHRVQIFDPDGTYVSQFGSKGTGDGQFRHSRGITTTPTHILVADGDNHRVQAFDLDGNYVSQFDRGRPGDGQFNQPRGITSNSTHILVADALNSRIQVFDLAPTVIITSDTPNGGIQNSNTVSYTVTFSEAVTGFVDTDIAVSGTADTSPSAVSNFDGTEDTYTFDVETTSDGTVTAFIPKLVATDTVNNVNLPSTAYAVVVSGTAPVINEVFAASDTYKAGGIINITVKFDEAVDVEVADGTPTLTLETGGTNKAIAGYDDFSSSGTDVVFSYMVAATHNSIDLNYVDNGSLSLNGGTITAATVDSTPASLTLPATTSDKSLAGTSDVIVDTTAPTLASVAITDTDTIELTISELLDETVATTGFTVSDNSIVGDPMISGSTITITVGTEIVSGEAITVSYDVATGAVTDVAGNALATFDMRPVTSSVLDTDPPTVVINSTTADNGNITTSRTLSYTAVFSETVTDFDVTTGIMLSGTATANVSVLDETGNTYTFDVTATTEGTVIISIPAGAALDTAGSPSIASDTYTIIISTISPTNSFELLNNGYRHNLTHLTGNYYVSSHTVTAPNTITPNTMLDSEVTLRLYSITSGTIAEIDSQVIQTNTQDRDTELHERNTEPKSTGLTRVDDDTIALSYVDGVTSRSVVATYDVNTAFPYFTETHSVDFRDGTNGDQTHHHSLITFDANRLVIAYSYPDSSHGGFIQVISIDPDTGDLSAGDPVTTTANQGLYHSVVKLNDDTVVVTYRGANARGIPADI